LIPSQPATVTHSVHEFEFIVGRRLDHETNERSVCVCVNIVRGPSQTNKKSVKAFSHNRDHELPNRSHSRASCRRIRILEGKWLEELGCDVV
jgi:hypothetical protein